MEALVRDLSFQVTETIGSLKPAIGLDVAPSPPARVTVGFELCPAQGGAPADCMEDLPVHRTELSLTLDVIQESVECIYLPLST